MTLFCFNLGVTILLSLTVFLNMVAETMPATSDAVPLLGMIIFNYPILYWTSNHPSINQCKNKIQRDFCAEKKSDKNYILQ